MKRFKHVCLIFLVLAALGCSKNDHDGSNSASGNNNANSEKPLHIEKALMTRPILVKNHQSDRIILRQLKIYLDHAPKGSIVHISIYLFSDSQVRLSLADAYDRGVEIHLLIDSGRVDASVKTNVKSFDLFSHLLKSPSEMITVNNDNTEGAINHEKYALFSEVHMPDGIAKNVVFATSHNFIPSAAKKVNDAIIMTNKGLYDAFLYNWKQVKSKAKQGMTDFAYDVKNVGDSITVFFFPRRKNGKWDGKDNIIEQLTLLDDDSYSKDTVNVFMAFWSGARVRIAEKLVDLQKKGVTVQVITRSVDQGVSSSVMDVLKELHDAGGYVKILDIRKENDHSKCMLLKGVVNGKTQRLILTGSHNYTDGALAYNNEFLLKLKNSVLFKTYWRYFKDLQSTLDDFSKGGWGNGAN